MGTRPLSTVLTTALALSLAVGTASAQPSAPPADVPTAAALGASASPLVGQGYLPSVGGRDRDVPTGTLRMEHQRGRWHPVR